jgi:hypothetical protein
MGRRATPSSSARVLALAAALLVPLPALADDDLDRAERGASRRSSTAGRSGSLGLGLVAGEPAGLTAKLLLGRPGAVQVHLGYGIRRKGHLTLVADYLFHARGLLPGAAGVGEPVLYAGVGGRVGIRDDDPLIAVRVPFGFSFFLARAPLEFFLELAIGVGLVPETEPLVDGGAGARFYF